MRKKKLECIHEQDDWYIITAYDLDEVIEEDEPIVVKIKCTCCGAAFLRDITFAQLEHFIEEDDRKDNDDNREDTF